MKILAISGSLRNGSHNTELLRKAAADAPAGLELELYEGLKENASVPGVLKNALDWVSRPLESSPVRNKPVAVISSSTGMFGGVWAAAETRKVLGALGARCLDDTTSVPKAE